jgi:hypothetical protein
VPFSTFPECPPEGRDDGDVDAARQPDGSIGVAFSYDEALVLSDLLARWTDRDGPFNRVPLDQAERRVLSDLTASFEPLIDEVFDDDYDAVVERARAALRPASE